MAFQRDFNELLDEILTAYRNQFGEGSITGGSVLFAKSSCSASVLWGLYQALGKVADQMFVSTANREYKERHAAEFGIPTVGRTDAQIVDAVLEAKRSKMSGGNKYDYIAWAKEVALDDEHIIWADVEPLAQGEGTFDIVVLGSQGQGEASPEICDKIYDHIQTRRLIGSGFSWGMRVCKAVPQIITPVISATGINWQERPAVDAIRAYINGLVPGQPLQPSMISAIMHDYGADVADVRHPTNPIPPQQDPSAGAYSMFRAIDIIVEE